MSKHMSSWSAILENIELFQSDAKFEGGTVVRRLVHPFI